MLTRRSFLAAGAAALPILLGTPRLFAAEPTPRRRPSVVVVFCRGGADCLNLVVPFAEPKYATLRKDLAIKPPGQPDGAIDLDGKFGLHPALEPLNKWFKNGTMTALHAVANPSNTRSHFEEQDTWECCDNSRKLEAGWLGRVLQATAANNPGAPVRALALGGSFPRSLRGPVAVAVADSLDALPLPGPGMEEALQRLGESESGSNSMGGTGSGAASKLFAKASKDALTAADALRQLVPDKDRPADPYARRCVDAATAIRSSLGIEVVEIDLEGWDTHQQQGTTTGAFADKARTLGTGLDLLLTRLGDDLDHTVVITMTEFGRTAAINGTAGTDHGWGGCMLLAGGPILRAKHTPVIGKWPGLDDLQDGRDLHHTTDFRNVVCGLGGFLGAGADVVAPGHAYQDLRLLA